MKVLKFGGTSVGSPERIRGVCKIIESQSSDCMVVVSAFQGITDELKQACELACTRNSEYKSQLSRLTARHSDYAKQLLDKQSLSKVNQFVQPSGWWVRH